jgi:hypothetical protein
MIQVACILRIKELPKCLNKKQMLRLQIVTKNTVDKQLPTI